MRKESSVELIKHLESNTNNFSFLAFDVDNTVTESCEVMDSEMVNIFTKLSKHFTLLFISGTDCKELFRMISSVLPCEHYLLGNSGIDVQFVSSEGEVIVQYSGKLSEDEIQQIVIGLEKVKQKFDLQPLTSVEDQIILRGSQITFSILGRNAPKQLKASFDPSREKRKKYSEYLYSFIPEDKYDARIGGTTSIDITCKGNDKGSNLIRFANYLGFSEQSLLFFGDQLYPGGNDYAVKEKGFCSVIVEGVDDTKDKLRLILSAKPHN